MISRLRADGYFVGTNSVRDPPTRAYPQAAACVTLGLAEWGGWPTTLRGSSPAFLAGKKSLRTRISTPHQNHLTSINAEIDRRDGGNVLIARRISDI
jgi:hypothetical protein